ncbi:helix-turn-helix domain-containing protein [Haladaptatus sp. DYF46]|uniref:winged helix-turn-helix domain-containing protein n=1 Tax=Haladaptatus sp. DYF46 TaxID=2886041 RepID=UPI001E39C6A6|nr:helix-turn-helix domain-containing protein [Haladaptatus sp. DYF46]
MADDDEIVVEHLSTEMAFELVAHETRLAILEVLNTADQPLSFGELRNRVGADDPGGFNYHLNKLVDRFVTNGEQGYKLADPGRRVVGGILSGGYSKALDADPVPVDGTCSECDGQLEAQFHAGGIRIVCHDCEFEFTDPQIPAGVFEGIAREDAPLVADQWVKRIHSVAEYGFCYNCDGRLDREVVLPSDDHAPDWLTGEDLEATVIYDCQRCGVSWQSILPYAILHHPAVIAFHYEHGIDLRTTPDWSLDWPTSGISHVVNSDPVHVEIPISLDDETLLLTADRHLDVISQRTK